MRNALSLFLCMLGAIALTVAPCRSAQHPFSLTISTEHDSIKAGSEVFVQIALTNTSNQQIALGRAPGDLPQAESEYSVDVHDSKGREASETEYGRKIKQKKMVVSFGRVSTKVEPGESLKDGVILTKLYKLSHPDKYTVQLTRYVPPQLGGGTVKSNIITITVTE